nr:uncharacterized protein LOC109186242 [Ipomoea batatas]
MGFGIFGLVLRDSAGDFVAAKSVPWRGVFTPREAEAVAVQETLSWIKELNHKNVQIVIDSLLVVQGLNASEENSYFHLIMSDIRSSLSDLTNVFLSFTKRSTNQAAHELLLSCLFL